MAIKVPTVNIFIAFIYKITITIIYVLVNSTYKAVEFYNFIR